MNAFSLLTSSFSLHLVQVLAHFLWQGLLIALVAAGASWLLRRRSAQSRYLLNLGALGLMVLCLPATSMVLERYGEPKTPVSPSPAPAAESAPLEVATEPRLIVPNTPMGPFSTESAPQTTPPSTGNAPETPADVSAWSWQSLAPYATSVYLLGVAVMLVRLVLGLAVSYRMRQHLRPVVEPELLELVTRQARTLGLRFVPAMCYCERIAVPALVGVLRPMVLLPLSLASSLAPQEIEAILTHELAHLRRYDPLVNLLQRIVEAVLFFHPAVWYVSRRIGLEREHCCDDLVVAAGKQPLAYAQSLVRIAELSLNATQPRLSRWAALLRSSGDRPSQLRGRILRLLGDVEDSRVRLTRAGALAFVAVVVAGVAIALGALRATAADGDPPSVDAKAADKAVSQNAKKPLIRYVKSASEADSGKTVAVQDLPVIEGRLVDEENRPLDDAIILATDAEGQDIGSDRTKEGGRFVLQDIPQGRSVQDYRYWACLRKTATESKRVIILQAQPLLLRLERPLAIEGTVVDPEGQPVAGAAVEIIRSDRMWINPHPGEEPLHRSTRTDAAGRFVLTGFPASTSQVVFVRHLERKLSAFVTVDAPHPDPDKPTATLRVPLQPGGRVVGRVLVDGRPQAGVEVPLVKLSPNLAVAACSAVTNAQGYYSIEGVTPGLPWTVWLPFDRGNTRNRGFTVKPGETVELESLHLLRQPKSIAGLVVDPQGNPVPQAEIRVAMRDESLGEIPYNFTHTVEKDGRFRVNLLPDVPLRVTAMIRPLANAPDQRVLVSTTVDANAGDENVRIVLRTGQGHPPTPPMMRETASILTGKVLLPDGTPTQGASIALATRRGEVTVRGGGLRWTINSKPQALAETAADGSFQITREPCPSVLVVAHKSGYAEVTTEEFARSNTVQLRPWGRLEGEMVLSGKPVAGQTIDVGAGRGDVDVVLNYNDSATTDAAGKFVVERVPPVRLFVNPLFRRGDSQYNLFWFSGQVSIAPGETTRIAIPRPGRPVIGRLAFPPESGLRLADFSIEASIMLRPPSMAGFTINVGDTDQDHGPWEAYGEFMKSEFGKAFRRDKIPIGADGTFRIEELPETSYLLRVTAVRKPGSRRADGSPTDAYIARDIDIPPLAESSEPVDVGELILQPQERQDNSAPAVEHIDFQNDTSDAWTTSRETSEPVKTFSGQVPEVIERGMMLDAYQQRERWPAPPPVEQPGGGTWSLQVPEAIERGMMMDRVPFRAKPR